MSEADRSFGVQFLDCLERLSQAGRPPKNRSYLEEWIEGYKGVWLKVISRSYLAGESWWCGYVGIKSNNSFFKKNEQQQSDLRTAPGGVTYADWMDSRTIDKIWWIGFDHNHSWDKGKIFTVDDIFTECQRLADEIIEKEKIKIWEVRTNLRETLKDSKEENEDV